MKPQQYTTDIAMGNMTGGLTNGGIAAVNGRGFWYGDIIKASDNNSSKSISKT